MNIYKISQQVNKRYNTYDSAIVAANTIEEAKYIHPSTENKCSNKTNWDGKAYDGIYDDWCDVEDVKVELIGIAKPGTIVGVILTSYNEG